MGQYCTASLSPTHEDREEEDAGHPAAGHENDLRDVLGLLVLPDGGGGLGGEVETPDDHDDGDDGDDDDDDVHDCEVEPPDHLMVMIMMMVMMAMMMMCMK